ncbi:tandem-95 repeat protein [Myxococcus sp. CA056]|uniref:myxosortase-dependent M36 family metallopeptidase n=1 Tax=Myxococcus sp. CA056 TaxID=2741740 RepID=UPI00157B3AD0|nr:tandem-95 repeat protein [Myxococcus sp. CA056]
MRRLVAKLSGLALVLSGTGSFARTLPNYDAFLEAKPAGRTAASFKPVDADTDARVTHRDEHTGAPRFLWATGGAQNKLKAQYASMAPAQAALTQLNDYAAMYGVKSFEVAGARVSAVKQLPQGVKVVTVAQEVSGVEVFRQSLRLLLNKNNELVSVSGTISEHVTARAAPERMRFKLSAKSAIAAAFQDVTGSALDGSLLNQVKSAKPTGRYTRYALASYARPQEESLREPARAKQVYYALPNALVPAYYVEVITGRENSVDSDAYAYVISALDGRVLSRKDMREQAAFSYRVFADTTPPYTPHDGPAGTNATPHPDGAPTGFRPAFVPPSLVTLQNAPYSQNDPWLAAGATVTAGNNVDAYADLFAPDFFSAGDLRPTVTAPGVFDRTMLFDIQPNANAEQIAAATTSLFYLNNWLHDWYYDSGFDELSGNAQLDNFERGGEDGDPIQAQAQDYSGTDNANMLTPADGASPRMQMYRFSGPRETYLTVNAPAHVAGNYAVGIASGMGAQAFDVVGNVVIALDEVTAGGPSTTDGCTPLTNAAAVAGNIALIDRGGCGFVDKLTSAQAAGATGVIIADNAAGPVADMGGTSTTLTIPALRITLANGNLLRNEPGLNVRLFRAPSIGPDGTVDNIIVAHEWGHYISNRLILDAGGLVNQQGRSMGEGWADFHALLMVTRAEDINVPSNPDWTGAYGAAEFAPRYGSPDSAFFGIRRVTYSSDMAKNALTFRHIANSSALPTTAPIITNTLPNSQFHNSGEVWATMLWEAYTSLLRVHPFQEAQDRMKQYIVLGYMQTPYAPTFLEARDAILAGAYAIDPADAERMWTAFAKRGAGVGAVAPSYVSTTHEGLVESFRTGPALGLVSATLSDDLPTGSCDRDGVLDNGETGRIVVTIANTGSHPARNASVTVFSPSRGVVIGNAGVVRLPEIPVFGQVTVALPVTLTGAATASVAEFIIAFRDENQAVPGDVIAALNAVTNYDEAPETSRTENVQSNPATLPWELESSEAPEINEYFFGLVYVDDAFIDRAFFGENREFPTDFWLKTPPLNVSATAPFIVSFDHTHDFEADANANYDGAVIELTEDNGQTWIDIGVPLYGGVLDTAPGVLNPLQGRQAIVGTSANFPTLDPATLDLGTTYAGKTVQIRFRIGTDNFVGATGWALDNLSFSGIDNTPFTSLAADNNVCLNRPPVANAGPDQTVPERTAVTVAGSATDADGNPLTYTWTQFSGTAVTLSGADTATVTFTSPEVASDRDIVLRLNVSDGSLTSTDFVTVRVLNVNRAPTVNAGLDGSANERGSFTLSGSASDADGDSVTYLWTQVSGTPVALTGYTAASATFATPEVDFDTTLTFRLTVSDGKVSVNDTVDVVIHDVNRAPVVTASSVTVDERSTANLTATASDADGDTLTYAWTQLSGAPVTLSGADTATASFATGEVAANAVLTFRVTVSDGTATATQDVTVNVLHINRAPTVNAGLDGSVNERAVATLSGSASDVDGDALTYTWVQTAGTPVGITNATSAIATFTAPETATGETLTFRLTVSDGGSTASDTVNVQVNPVNRTPAVTASPVTVNERTTATLIATGTDPDGDTLTYAWTQLSGAAVTLSGANTATATFTAAEVITTATLTFRVTVSDGTATASHDVTVTVLNANRAPTANAGADGTVGARSEYTLSGVGGDADGDVLTYTWVQTAGTPVGITHATTSTARFTAPDSVETLTFRLTVSDGTSVASDSVNVAVTRVNRAPSVTASAVTADERSTVSLVAQGVDPDGDALTYAWAQLSGTPTVTLENANTATATFDAGDVDDDAELTFRVTVSDGGATANQTVTVTLRNVNRAPTANAGAAASAVSGTTVTLDGSASSDPDGTSLSYTWTQISGPSVALSNAVSAQPSFTAPSVEAQRDLVFSLVVNDGAASSAASLVVITINPAAIPNRSPVVTASAVTADERSTVSLVSQASDPDGDTLTYAWTQLTGATVELQNADAATATFDAGNVDDDAVLTFRVTVSDGTFDATQDVTVTVRNVNRAPTANAGTAASAVSGATVSLNGGASSDPDGATLTYQWTQVSGPAVTLSNATAAQPTFTAPTVTAERDLVFALVVSDGAASSTASLVVITITAPPVPNRAPVVTASAVTADERSTVSLVAHATDADGDTLTYAWTQLTGTTVTLQNANTATASFSAGEVDDDAALSFRVTVSDGDANVNATVTVTVRNVNRAPTANAGPAASAVSGATVTLDGSASSDPDSTTVTYLWTQISGPAVTLSEATAAQPTFTAPTVTAERDLVFSLVVNDGAANSSASLVVITITAAPVENVAPVAKARIILNGSQTSMTLDGSASSDANGDALTYKWEQTGGPSVTLNESTKAVLNVDVPELDDDSATFTFKLTVKDSHNATHSVTVAATATPDDGGGCSSTGAGAPAGMLALALLSLLHRRRRVN